MAKSAIVVGAEGSVCMGPWFDKGVPPRQEKAGLPPRDSDQMSTLLVSQPNFESHVTPSGHPERAGRIRAVEEALSRPRFDKLVRKDAISGDLALADLVHSPDYLKRLRAARPAEGIGRIDEDTFISSGSLDAVATALGGALMALEAVLLGTVDNAFCAIRPPGHHAEQHGLERHQC